MNTTIVRYILVSVVLIIGFTIAGSAQENAGNYAPVNGLNLYYEIHGTGEPLILIHGGLGGVVEFGALLPLLAETRQVIAVELQGHGHTEDIDRPLTFEAMADDIAALIQFLELEQADVLGFSLGGGVALQTAIRHPEVVRKLILISTAYRRDGIHAEFLGGMQAMNGEAANAMIETPMYQYYASVAPNLDHWASIVDKLGNLFREDFDWTDAAAEMTVPTLIIAGDSDFITPTHAVDLFGLLGGGVAGDFVGMPTSRLALLPATSHFTILTRTDLLLPLINPFLDAE